MAKISLEQLIEIAFSIEDGDPIEWEVFAQGKPQAMTMIGTSVLEQFDKETYTEDERLIMLSTITKLVTENMILQARLLKKSNAV